MVYAQTRIRPRNEKHKILQDQNGSPNSGQKTKPSVNRKKNLHFLGFAVRENHRMKIEYTEKINKTSILPVKQRKSGTWGRYFYQW